MDELERRIIEKMVQQYKHHREQASYHYADDSIREWKDGDVHRDMADNIRKKILELGGNEEELNRIDSQNL